MRVRWDAEEVVDSWIIQKVDSHLNILFNRFNFVKLET